MWASSSATSQLKAGWLGVDKLRRYDIYAPLAESDRDDRLRRRRVAWCSTPSRSFEPRVRPAGQPGLRPESHRQRGAPRQAGRRLLHHGPAQPDAVGADELHRQGARRGDPGPRTGPRHPQHDGRGSFGADPARGAAAGRDRLGLRRDPADRSAAGRGAGPAGAPRDAGLGRGRHVRHGHAPGLLRALRAGRPCRHPGTTSRPTSLLCDLHGQPAGAVRRQRGDRARIPATNG